MANEIWEPITGLNDYHISNYGNLKSFKHNNPKIRKPERNHRHNRDCYKVTDNNGDRVRINIARTVYKTFVGPLVKGKIIDHINNDCNNNSYKNLQQITQRENVIKDRKNNRSHSIYPGVTISKQRVSRGSEKIWRAVIYILGANKYLGFFSTEEEAANAYKIEFDKLCL